MFWGYYRDGQLKEVKDFGGQATNYVYDAGGNLTSAADSAGLTVPGETSLGITASYDGFDRLTKVRHKKQADGNYRFTLYSYDDNSNVTDRTDDRIETPGGGLVSAGRSSAVQYNAVDLPTTHYDYGLDTGDTDDQRTTTTYLPTDLLESQTLATKSGGTWVTKQVTDKTFFANGQLRTLTTKNGAVPADVLETHTVSYEDGTGAYVDGHRTTDTYRLVGPDSAAPCDTTACTETYTYDARGRLLSENDGHGTTTSFTVDPAGNVTRETATGATARDFTYVGNQLQTLTVGSDVTKHFYDPNGNLDCTTNGSGSAADCIVPTGTTASSRLRSDYGYDYLNRLTLYRTFTSSTEQDRADYAYDALDRPVAETERDGASGSPKTLLFAYVGLSNSISEEQEKNASGSLLETKTYSYDAFGRASGLTSTASGQTNRFTYGYDTHGSVSLLLGQSGTATAAYGYRPYGTTDTPVTKGDTSTTDPINPYRYTGKRLDTGSATLDMGARRFSADTGRFLQADVFSAALSNLGLSIDPLGQNRYALAAGNPLSFIEVDGHFAMGFEGMWDAPPHPVVPEPLPPPPAPTPAQPAPIGSPSSSPDDENAPCSFYTCAGQHGVPLHPAPPSVAPARRTQGLGTPVPGAGGGGGGGGGAGAAVVLGVGQLVKITAKNFRKNLTRFRGYWVEDFHAHHIMPKEFATKISRMTNGKVDVNHPRFGAWVEKSHHVRTHQQGYNAQWEAFLQKTRSEKEILQFARGIAKRSGIKSSEIYF